MTFLYVTTISATMDFFPAHIRMLQDGGHTVALACNLDQPLSPQMAELGCDAHHIPFSRSPASADNLRAYRALNALLAGQHFDVVHTHTPNASALVRLACRKLRRRGLRVFYTAHGFHFYRGAPLKNWLLYYPVEALCARYTDRLITMNREDYAAAQRLCPGRARFVHGVGIDPERFSVTPEGRAAARSALGLGPQDILALSVGELSPRKNHETAIRAVLQAQCPQLQYWICGEGPLRPRLEGIIEEASAGDRIRLLGRRDDVPTLCAAADLFLFPSLQEGLPVALMEAMAAGLPAIASRIRGNVDLLVGMEDFLHAPTDGEALSRILSTLLARPTQRRTLGALEQQTVSTFSTAQVLEELAHIYHLVEESTND